MALPFNGDFLLLESSPGEQPEGKAASHLQSLIVFSRGSSHSLERGRLIPGGNKHSKPPPKLG